MIELRNVNKYFNKGRKNAIHVINNTSLTLENNGLVALLGNSGSGKTTLLNAIGGLDNVQSGSIYIDGQKLNSKLVYKTDKIRNLNIGYIFQDYKLIDNLSVYDNVALVLTMIGIKNKDEINKRVSYVLDKVGMLRYKKRPAGMLSGGERQRVGIARALVKDPNIILADEPTGNLDSKNSLEIMKIIKAISKERLVILVTHEQALAKFYASRIIEIKDGTITNDYLNEHADTLDYEIDNCFYLKDFSSKENLSNKDYNINIYSEVKEKINLDIVLKNGNIYIKSKNKEKIEVIDDNSNIEFIDDHYRKINKEDILNYDFDLKKVINSNEKKRYSSIFNPLTLIINGFKKVFAFSFLKKILLGGFFLSGIFIMYAVSSIFASLNVKDEDFVKINRNYLTIVTNNIKVEDFLGYEKKDNIKYLIPGSSIVNLKVKYDDYYQTSKVLDNIKASLSDISMIKEEDLIYGRMPENNHEIVLDELSIKNTYEKNNAKMAGLTKVSDMLDRLIYIDHMEPFKIVGIVRLNSPSVYVERGEFTNIIANSPSSSEIDDGFLLEEARSDYYNTTSIVDYDLYKEVISLKEGRAPQNDYEVIVNIDNKYDMPLNKEISLTVNDQKLKVVGYYTSRENYNYYLVNNNTIKYLNIRNASNITVYTDNKDATINEFRNLNLNIRDSYEQSKSEYLEANKENVRNTLIVSGIILLISLVEIFLMIRSSFLSRIKEIGIYRAIGVKKSDIYKMFYGEIFAITTLASLPGLIFMAYILSVISSIKFLSRMFLINPGIIIISIIFIYLFNLIVGLIPVFTTIRKTPAQILARHDLD